MKKVILYSSVLLICGLFSFSANAQKFAVKASGDIGLGNALSLSSDLPGLTTKSSSNAFGVDFGYTFWQKGNNSLAANIGLGYRMASATFDVSGFEYNYAAPAAADNDGNPYQRYTSLSDVNQKVDMGYLNIPVYLQYQYRITNWLGVHADLGFGLGFKCAGKVSSTKGKAYSYGVYPEYDNLLIDADYLNDFGNRDLANAKVGATDIKGFSASILAGAGFEFYVGGPVSIDLGLRYNAGLTGVFGSKYAFGTTSKITHENAPVTYTVADGQQIKALSSYSTKSHLNPFSLHIGVNVRF
ncbi:MAG: outer membrane beta-barrel protein [Muribaculaceae bacterium]|nr:outer membrane beta-barrel protein [Muribaculaceae bacterium]